MGKIILKDINLITPFEERKEYNVIIKDNLISDISNSFDWRKENILKEKYDIYELKDKYLVPGFIDIHTHGGVGVNTWSMPIIPWIDYNLKNGVTSFIPTIMTMPFEKIVYSLKNLVKEIEKSKKKTNIAGINIEGPYINPNYGAQLSDNCLIPDELFYKKIIELSKGYLKIMTIAPELDGVENLIKELIKNKIIVSIGHTNASMNETIRAVDLGANLATHIFNAYGYSRGLFKELREGKICGVREVKALEVLLSRDDVYTEVISDRDGIHVNPILLDILVKCKGINKIILITDSMSMAGMPSGKCIYPDGREFMINTEKSDLIWLKEGSALGGSIMKLKDAAKNFIKHTGISLKDAIKAITVNPAKLLGIENKVGSIKIGKIANLVVIDKKFNIYMTLLNGEIVYKNMELK